MKEFSYECDLSGKKKKKKKKERRGDWLLLLGQM